MVLLAKSRCYWPMYLGMVSSTYGGRSKSAQAKEFYLLAISLLSETKWKGELV